MGATPSFLALGFLEILVLFSGGGMLGMPPGERDAAFLKAAPAETLVYLEWAERAVGKPGAPGIDGLVADPEVKAFIESVERAIVTMVEKSAADGNPEKQIAAKAIPPLVLSLLKRPGCLYGSFDAEVVAKATANGAPLGPLAALSGLRFTLIVNGGEDTEAMAKSIDELLGLLPPESKTAGLKMQPLPLPLPGIELMLHRHRNYFIVGLGKDVVDAAVTGLTGDSKGLSGNERFITAMKNVSIERTAGVSWIDVKGIVESATKAMGEQGAVVAAMATMVGADAIDSIASTTGVVNGQIRKKNFMATGGRSDGILALTAGRGIKPADLAHIPADADFVFALSLNAPKILKTVRDVVGKADASSLENLNKIIAQLEKELNVSLEDDLFEAFGNVWTVYDSPSAGGFYLTSLVASLEVQDPRKAYEVFTKLMQVLKESLPGERDGGNFRRRAVHLAQKKFMDRTIYYVNIVGDDDVPFAPSFCVTDKQLLVAPHPQALKAHLRFLDSRDENFASRLVGDKELPKGDLLCLTHFDCKKLTQQIYAFAPYLAQVAFTHLQSSGGEIDIFSLPSARAILPYLNDSSSTIVRTTDGILSESRNGLPFPGGFGPGLLLPLSAIMGITMPRRMRIGVGRPLPARVVAPGVRIQIRRVRPAVIPADARKNLD